MSEMDEVTRATLYFLRNDASYQRWLTWLFDPLETPMFSMLFNPYDGLLREWQLRERP